MARADLTEREVAEAYRRFGHLVVRRCQTVLREAALAEDALQEVFVRLMRYGRAFRGAADPLRWLYRVADRVCFDLLARRRIRPNTDASERMLADLPAPGPSPGERIADRDTVMRVLAGLDERSREIALLYYVDGLSQGEIAEAIGTSRQTVNKRLGQVRRRTVQKAAEG